MHRHTSQVPHYPQGESEILHPTDIVHHRVRRSNLLAELVLAARICSFYLIESTFAGRSRLGSDVSVLETIRFQRPGAKSVRVTAGVSLKGRTRRRDGGVVADLHNRLSAIVIDHPVKGKRIAAVPSAKYYAGPV